jgi:AcrR family transcriptional regulator
VVATEEASGRYRQRRRTRAAIVAAAADLLREGRTPSVNDVADAADVSRRTVYQYFPTFEQLLIDATLGLLSQTAVDEAIDAADTGGDVTERVAAMVRALNSMSAETLALGRSLIRLTVDTPAGDDQDSPRRGYRRIAWIERALEPLRPELDAATFERLVSSLAMVVGWEALIVLDDLRGLPPDERTETALWAARALVRAALEEDRAR